MSGTSASEGHSNPSTNTNNFNSGPKVKAAPRAIPPWLAPLRFMGVPQSVLRWQPKLPSRNWSIFLSISISLTSLYVYDRRESQRIKLKYQSMVSHLAQENLRPNQWPRKVSVFTAKCPGEDGSEEAVIYFKKYVKPILVAAAIDWDLTNGTRHGGLAREITERIYSRRRQLLGLEPFPIFQSSNTTIQDPDTPPPPFSLTPEEQLQRELDGATVLIGRSAFKEFNWGLRQGWTTPCTVKKLDRDDLLAKKLAEDGTFDELEKRFEEEKKEKREKEIEKGGEGFSEENKSRNLNEDVFLGEEDGAGAPLPTRLNSNPNPIGMNFNSNPAFNSNNKFNNNDNTSSSSSSHLQDQEPVLLPPDRIPAQPPLHLISYEPVHGWRNIPIRLVGFFNHRKRFENGGKEGVRIALSFKEQAREIQIDSNSYSNPNGRYDEKLNKLLNEGWRNDDGDWLNTIKDEDLKVSNPPQNSKDLDFDLESESKIPPYFLKTLTGIEKSRENFESNLYERFKATKEISSGEREPHRSEKGQGGKINVKTVFELKEERFKKEKEWRGEEHGYEISRLDRGVAWSDRFLGSIRIGRSWENCKEEAERFGIENNRREEELLKIEEIEKKELEEKKKELENEV